MAKQPAKPQPTKTQPAKKSSKKKQPARKQPARKPSARKQPANKHPATKLVAKYVLQVNSRAEVDALPADERKRFVAGTSGIVGGKTLDQVCKNLGALLMGVMKLHLFRGSQHVYDVWINTVIDDGSVMLASSTKHSGIGISQTRVYDHEGRDREDEIAAIQLAIYKGGVKYPPFVEATF